MPHDQRPLRVDVALGPGLHPALGDAPAARAVRAELDVVVIDVLRATSTIVSALVAGCEGVQPVATLEEARALARGAGGAVGAMPPGVLLGGEREGLAPPGFDLGNSPDEYTAAACAGRRVVLSTTNGTQAVAVAAGARSLWAGSLLNAEATCRALLAAGARDVLLVCAGTRGRVAADDVAAAGCMAGSLLLMDAAELSDSARVAVALFDAWKHDLPGLLRRCESGQRLQRIGLERDVPACARVDRDRVAVRLDADGVFRVRS